MTVRLGVIGAGLIGRRHIQTILRSGRAKLVGVADPILNDLRDSLAAQSVPTFGSYSEMLDQTSCDAVVVATPNDLHVPVAIDCARRGLHLLIEKPIAETMEAAQALLAAIREAGVKALVGHHRRYAPAIQTARRLVAEGQIGKLVGASVLWATRKPDAYFDVEWRKREGGGPVLINLIHEIDNLRFICGEVESVVGVASNGVRGFEVEDTSGAILRFQNGALATVLCSDAAVSPWTTEQGLGENAAFAFTGENSVRLVGTLGALELPNLVVWTHRQPDQIGWDKPLSPMPLKVADRDPWLEQIEHFCAVIKDDVEPVISAEDGARTLEVTLAVLQSNRSGQPVNLPSRSLEKAA